MKQNKIVPLQELTLLDRFLFDETMEDREACQAMLEIALESEGAIELQASESEKEMRTNPDLRAVRLDIFAKDEEEIIYNAEMQGKNTGNLPRRSRYYQAHLDVTLLEIGETDFNTLNDSYMIMITPFDLFGKGKYKYTFRMRCEEDSSLELADGAVRIFLNTKGTDPEGVSQELIDFLKYIEHPDEEKVRNSESPRLGKIHNRVCKVKASEEMGVKYMQEWEEKIYIREEGKKEGMEEGRKEGLEEGLKEGLKEGKRAGMEALILDNLEENKTEEEIIRKLIRRFAVSEEEARELFEKYGCENHKKE